MTAQIREILSYNGNTYHLATEPLQPLLDILGDKKPSSEVEVWVSSCCWRGYIGTWEIVEDKLFLIQLKGNPEENEEFNMDSLFPNQNKVFAAWYTGEIKIPYGKLLHYEHMGYMSIYEKDLFLEFNKGILVATREVDNTKTFDPKDPLGWDKIARDLYEYNLKNLKKGKPSSPDGKLPDK
jgi:hypothetical protein